MERGEEVEEEEGGFGEGGREEGDHSCHNTLQYWNWAEH